MSIPPDLEPLMVALMVGVTTDYVVYFLSGLRGELVDGRPRLVAARRSVATFAPIVAAAGLTVAAGVGALLVASSPAVRTFGPAMALAVAVALARGHHVRPGRMAILGRNAFWPAVPHPQEDRPLGGVRSARARARRAQPRTGRGHRCRCASPVSAWVDRARAPARPGAPARGRAAVRHHARPRRDGGGDRIRPGRRRAHAGRRPGARRSSRTRRGCSRSRSC